MKAEHRFVAAIERDLKGEFWLERVEQKYKRGFPDLVFIDCRSELSYALIEAKVADKHFSDYYVDSPITIKSLKPHQIGWLESRCLLGGRIRPGIGMLLLIRPRIFYIRGDKVARWRDKPAPTCNEVIQMAAYKSYDHLDPTQFRFALYGR